MVATINYLEATELEGIQTLTLRDFLEGAAAGLAIGAAIVAVAVLC
jgi:hypothetical protein